jgi:predicted permease
MSWLARLRNVLRSDRTSADIDREMAFHLAERIDELVAGGKSPAAAREEATQLFGHYTTQKENTRDGDILVFLDSARADCRYALRTLWAAPRFTIVTVLCVGLGIGVTTTMFAAARAFFLRPLPFADASRLAVIHSNRVDGTQRTGRVSIPEFEYWRRANRSFADIAIWTENFPTLDGPEDAPDRVPGAQVSANLFTLVGMRTAFGRPFSADEARPGAGDFVVLGEGLWRSRYGGDSSIVGRSIQINGAPHVVLGVIAGHVVFPEGAQLWRPLRPASPTPRLSDRQWTGAIGRLEDGVGIADARRDLAAISRRLAVDAPRESAGWVADVRLLRDELVGSLRHPMAIFLGAAVAVLLICCVNVASLLLARSAARTREIAVRLAIGASRTRVVRQLLTESAAIAVAGAGVGALVVLGGVPLLTRTFPDGVPSYVELAVDPIVLSFTLIVAVFATLIFGLVPAVRATRTRPELSLRSRIGQSFIGGRLLGALIATEVALSFVLLVGAVLLVRSSRTLAKELRFDPRGVVSVRVPLPSPRYDGASRAVFFDALFARIRELPDVVAVGSTPGAMPLGLVNPYARRRIIAVEGIAGPIEDRDGSIVHELSAGYFASMGVPLRGGRDFSVADRDTTHPVAIVNEAFVKRYLGGADPIGKRIRWAADLVAPSSSAPQEEYVVTIVGISADFRQERPPASIAPAMFLYRPFDVGSQTLAIRTNLPNPLAIVPSIRAIVRQMDATIPIYQVTTLENAIARGLWRERMQTDVLGLFAVIALLLAVTGVYGVIS